MTAMTMPVRKMPMSNSVLSAIRIPADLKARAEAAGIERGLKLSQVMRLALAEWLARLPAKPFTGLRCKTCHHPLTVLSLSPDVITECGNCGETVVGKEG
jgi:ribosomal protein S27E